MKNSVFILILLTVFSCQDKETELSNDQGNRATTVSINEPLFQLLKPSQTNIDFVNQIKESPNINILSYEYFYNGGGVAIGDINNDGLDDIYFTGNFVTNRLYLNKGNFEFEDITQKAGVQGTLGWTTGVTMADVNSDGLLDIYVCKSGKLDPANRENQLFINNGNNTFKESAKQYGLNDPSYSTQAIFFDMDKDNDLDMFLLNHSVRLFLGQDAMKLKSKRAPYAGDKLFRNDNGRFVDISEKAGIIGNSLGYGLGVAAGDINNDGWTDLYVTNDYVEPDYLYINNQQGGFEESIKAYTRHISNFAMGVDIADINNDGLHDVFVADMVAEDNYRQKTNMRAMNPEEFYQAVEFGFHHQYMHNTLQLNNGNGSLSEIAQLSGVSNTDWSWATLLSDFDNDGFKDLMVTNGFRKEFSNKDFVKLREKKNKQYANADSQTKVRVVKELLDAIPTQKINNYIYRNNGDLTFDNKIESWGFNVPSYSNGAAVGDLDNDGDLDIVINNIDQEAFVFKNNTRNANFLKVRLNGPKGNKSGLGAKVNVYSDELVQTITHYLTRGFQSSNSDYLNFGLGRRENIDSIRIIWPDGKTQLVERAPINTELSLDYAEADNIYSYNDLTAPIFKDVTSNYVNHKHNENDYDDFKSQVLLPHKMSQFGPALTVGDVNNDGLDDFYIGGATGESGTIYLQQPNSKFLKSVQAVFENDRTYEDIDAIFLDVDGDKDLDLYVVSGGNESFLKGKLLHDRLYRNDGLGNFEKTNSQIPELEISGGVVAKSDFDNDGDVDLFVGGRLVQGKYPFPADSYILRNTEGKFELFQPEVFKELGLVTTALWTDYDNDNDYDLAVTGEWMPIRFIRNDNGSFSEIVDLPNSSGWWYSLAQGDFDQDGDMDYIAGNLGLNYKYKASIDQPFEIFASDFDNNGNSDIVLSYQEDGKKYPLRGRQCSSEQMPQIAEKFSTYHEFGSASLIEVYGEEELESALKYSATTFASSYLENDGNGKFVIHKLPSAAQFSSVNSIIIKDIDKDKNHDIIMAGNLYTSEVETTRNDAGIGCVLSKSDKGFVVIPAHKSGLKAIGDVKKMRTIKSSNDTELLIVAKNDDYLQVLELN